MKYVLLLAALLFFGFSTTTLAADTQPFSLTGNFTYEISSSGSVKVREDITIKNLTTETYAPSFSFDTTGFSPQDVNVYESGLAAKLTQKDDHTYEATFKRPALGLGANKKVSILFTDNSLVTKHGKVVEIKIPRVKNIDQFANIKTTLRVSLEDSKTFHIYPETNGVKNGSVVEYSLDSSKVKDTAITAFLGSVAAFDFNLSYPFTNTSYFSREATFAIPPDTATQRVYIRGFSTNPDSLSYDSDGNWIGKLTLKAKESQTFTVSGTVFVFADYQNDFPYSNEDAIKLDTSAQQYWESTDPQIVKLANELKTPQAIYDYVVHNLSYDYTKTARPQERLGAKLALSNNTKAICMEFTDLFIALARAANIPAREINGFAVSNDATRPRSLGGDVLHSWPEYYDSTKKQWIQVDPTWGNTTGGVDYFSHFDVNHITFVIHGASSTFPQTPGTYETSDENTELVQIEPSMSVPEALLAEPKISISRVGFSLWQQKYQITIENATGQAIYNIPVKITTDNAPFTTKNIPSVLPFSKASFVVELYPGFFGSKLPRELGVSFNELHVSKSVTVLDILIAHSLALIAPLILVPLGIYTIIKRNAKH